MRATFTFNVSTKWAETFQQHLRESILRYCEIAYFDGAQSNLDEQEVNLVLPKEPIDWRWRKYVNSLPETPFREVQR